MILYSSTGVIDVDLFVVDVQIEMDESHING